MVLGGGGGGFNLGNAYGEIIIRTDSINASIQQAQQAFDRGIQQMGMSMQRMGDQISRVGSGLTLLTAPLVAFGATGLKTAASFDSAMTMISARTGLVGDSLEQVRMLALQLGADTVFSGQQAADAFLQLLSAGLSVEQAMSTLPAVLDGAAASGADLGVTADQVTNIMSSFSLEAEHAGDIVQYMSAAAASSPADMNQMGEALQLVGGVARGMGLDLEDTSAILAVFAQNGIRGSEAATQFRSVLRQMNSEIGKDAMQQLGVSMYDAAGNARDLDLVFKELNVALQKLPMEEQNTLIQDMAGSYGLVGFRALVAADGFSAMEETMRSQADVSEVAAKNMGTFKNTVESLKGSIETLQIEVLTPFMNETLKPMIQRTIEIVNGITDWVRENRGLTAALTKVFAVVITIGPALIILGKIISIIGGGITGLSTLAGFLATLLSGPVIIAVAAVVAAIVAWRKNLFGIQDIVAGVANSISHFVNILGFYVDAIRAGFNPWDILRAAVGQFANELLGAIGVSDRFIEQFVNGFYTLSFRVQMALANISNRISNFIQLIRNSFSALSSGTSPTLVFAAALSQIFPLKTVMAILRRVQQFIDGFKGLFSEIGTFLGGVFSNFNDAVKSINLKQIAKIGTTLWSLASPLGWIKLLIEQVFQVDLFKVFLDTLIDGVGRLTEFFSRLNSGQNLAQALGIDGTNTEGALATVGNALSRFITFINDEVMPGVRAFGNWFVSEGLPAALNYFLNTVLPGLIDGFTSVVMFVTESVIPGLQQLADWFLVNVLPMVINFVENIAIPGFKLLFQVLSDAWNLIGPALVQVANWFINDALPAIINFINTVAIPAIGGLIQRLSSFWAAIQPGLQAFFNWVTTEGLPLVVTFFNDVISPAVQTFIDILTGLWDAVAPALSTLFNWFMTEGLPEIQRVIENVIMPVLQTFIDILATLWDVIQPALSQFFDWVVTNGLPIIEEGVNGLISVWETLAGFLSGLWDTVSTGVTNFKNGLDTAFGWIKTNVIDPVVNAIKGIISGIQDAWAEVQRVGGQIRDFISSLPGVGGILGGSFASGIDYVPHDMVAQIHKGEAVLTADENAARLSGQGGGGLQIDSVVIYANSAAEGRQAADGLNQRLAELRRSKG